MPLSEHEQRMLDEMERQLFADDPRLARAFDTPAGPRRDRRRIVLGLLGVLVGLGILVLAVALPAIWLGVLAFLLMLASALAAVTAPAVDDAEADGEPATARTGRRGAAAGAAPAGSSDFMRRMEQRWERRSDGRG